jgi:hypothetical protein
MAYDAAYSGYAIDDSVVGFIEAVELDIASAPYSDLSSIHDYWEQKRAGRLAPRRRDIDPVDMVEMLPRIMLVDILGSPPRFRYRLSGTAIAAIHRTEPTGKGPLDLTPSAYGRLLDTHYRDCIKRRTPLMHLIVLDTFNRSRAYARLILPLSEDGETVTMLMTVDSRHQNNDALTDFFTLARG